MKTLASAVLTLAIPAVLLAGNYPKIKLKDVQIPSTPSSVLYIPFENGNIAMFGYKTNSSPEENLRVSYSAKIYMEEIENGVRYLKAEIGMPVALGVDGNLDGEFGEDEIYSIDSDGEESSEEYSP